MINYVLLFIALTVASVAGYYSIIGLTTIFSGAFWPVVVMASSLEAAKIVCTSWLQKNWGTAPRIIKGYLTGAVIVVSFITSLGVFGFLSKAHIQTTTMIGTSSIQIETIERQEQIVKERLKYLLKKAGDDPEKISKKTDALIQQTQKELVELNQKKLPLLQENSKMEAEVGPLKYVAELIYDKADKSTLESAVRGIIILIVLVFDPLALMMILAANHGINEMNKDKGPLILGNQNDGGDFDEDLSWIQKIKSRNNVIIGKDKIHEM